MKDELLIKFLLKETDKGENIKVQEWLDADPVNHAYYVQFEKIWTASKQLAAQSNIDEAQAWTKFKERANQSKGPGAIITPIRQRFGWLKIAAIFFIAVGTWATYSLLMGYRNLETTNLVVTEKLPDGSKLTLNKNTRLSYAANFKTHRNVRLTQGDVFFEVAHDKTRPFVIETDKVSITVVGTSFNVKRSQGETEVIVETGIVRVNAGNEEVLLHKGEKVAVRDAAPELIKEQNTDLLYNYYRTKLFIAQNTPLKKLIAKFNEAYKDQVHIVDPAISALTISTTFRLEKTLAENIEIIADTFPDQIKIQRNENVIELSKK